MSGLIVCTFPEVKRLSVNISNEGQWLYLGKDITKRETAARLLGEKGLLFLGDRLHVVAEGLRQPFLDFIGDLGKMQLDQVGWWSGSCSWKLPTASDLFLLICYEHLVDRIMQEREGDQSRLLIVIEDPWLYSQLRDAYGDKLGVKFQGTPSLWLVCVKATLRGFAARAAWTLRLLRNYLTQMWFWGWGKRPDPSEPSIAFYSHPQARCISRSDGWVDPYLGHLDRLLEEAGYSICRFSPPQVGGFERAIARRSRYFKPLILCAAPLSFLRAMTASWRPIWPSTTQVCGRPIYWLLLREWWQDRSRSSSFIYRVFFECMKRFLESVSLKLVIYPYENQPWEKLLILAARARGVSTLGYQHGGTVARFMLPYFHGRGEAEWAPLPDLIVTSDPYSHEALAEGGTLPERLVMGGNLRHLHLRDSYDSEVLSKPGTSLRILVALPIDSLLVQHLIHALRKAFPDGGRADGVEFAVKPHPMCPLAEDALGWPVAIVSGTLEDAIRHSVVVLYTWSSAGMEALAMGRRVIRYKSELLLNLNKEPEEFLSENGVIECGDHDLRTKVLSVMHEGIESQTRRVVSRDILKWFFTPVDSVAWLQATQRLCQERR